ncbi:MAG: FkbM family methyltransferase [Desulfovibrio sp.]|nr:FkbM family methyltransferase [Desulfovibrio sp.]
MKKEESFPDICVKDSYQLDKIEVFLLEGYRYKDLCCVRKGDIVLDCGAYTGNSALFFANQAGSEGKIYAFELNPANFDELIKNIKAADSPDLAPVIPAPKGVFDIKTSVAIECWRDYAPATKISGVKEDGAEENVIPLDDFVAENRLEKWIL